MQLVRTSGDADRSALLDLSTSASDLFEIAGRRPDLGALVAEHPNVYDDLLEWLAEYGDEAVKDAVTRRRAADAAGGDGPAGEEGASSGTMTADSGPVDRVPPGSGVDLSK